MPQLPLAAVKGILLKKPPLFVLVPFIYALGVVLVKWGIQPVAASVYFLLGTAVGIYFLDLAEVFFHLSPSPFRSILFTGGFAVVSFFVTSSSGSALASGLVFALYMTLLLWQLGEIAVLRNLDSWYAMFMGKTSRNIQLAVLAVFLTVFIAQTWVFLH